MGNALFETVVEATDLPDKAIRDEFTDLLERHGKDPATMTLDDLREVMADYLQDVFLEMKEGRAAPFKNAL